MAEGIAVGTPVPARGNLRLEPTVVPTRLYRLGRDTLGWHPVLVPARAPA